MTRHCTYCATVVDPLSRFTWRRVVGWERKSSTSSRKSGSDIALREPGDEYACDVCVGMLKSGRTPRQESLLS